MVLVAVIFVFRLDPTCWGSIILITTLILILFISHLIINLGLTVVSLALGRWRSVSALDDVLIGCVLQMSVLIECVDKGTLCYRMWLHTALIQW